MVFEIKVEEAAVCLSRHLLSCLHSQAILEVKQSLLSLSQPHLCLSQIVERFRVPHSLSRYSLQDIYTLFHFLQLPKAHPYFHLYLLLLREANTLCLPLLCFGERFKSVVVESEGLLRFGLETMAVCKSEECEEGRRWIGGNDGFEI